MRMYPLPNNVKDELDTLDQSHPIVSALVASGGATYAQLEQAAQTMPSSATGAWADKVVSTESMNRLRKMLDGGQELPEAVLAEGSDLDDIVIALKIDDQYFTKDGWTSEVSEDFGEVIEIDQDSIAYVASAFMDGAEAVIIRQWVPVAYISDAITAAAGDAMELPDNGVAVAIVDELDKNAVLELLAVAPGPTVYRRHAGSWQKDAKWLQRLREVVPPPMVKLETAQVASIVSQVDEATVGQPFEEESDSKDEKPMRASAGFTEEHWNKADEIAVRMALVAAKGNVAQGAKGAETLRRYWLSGKGAAKIRWGTHGDWKRCVKQLSKYLGVRSKGYCTLLHGRKLGSWPGHHGKVNPATKARAIAKELER